ncbi:MAG: CvpA family protein [Rhodocyclaceae bacterium]
MTLFDYCVLAVIAISLLIGAIRGMVGELLALAAWVVAFLAARRWAQPVGELLLAELSDPVWRPLAGFVAIFIAVLASFALLRRMIVLLLKATGLRPLDRALGALFGILRGAAILLVLVLLAGLTPLPQQAWWRQALFAAPLETEVSMIKPWLPPGLAKRIHYR